MTKDIIKDAQDYLTISNGNGKKRIMVIDTLLEKHPSSKVIDLLKTYLEEKKVELKAFILTDKTQPEIDETVAVMFRVTMAIKTIEDQKEVIDIGRAK
jgi:hypothetical protein